MRFSFSLPALLQVSIERQYLDSACTQAGENAERCRREAQNVIQAKIVAEKQAEDANAMLQLERTNKETAVETMRLAAEAAGTELARLAAAAEERNAAKDAEIERLKRALRNVEVKVETMRPVRGSCACPHSTSQALAGREGKEFSGELPGIKQRGRGDCTLHMFEVRRVPDSLRALAGLTCICKLRACSLLDARCLRHKEFSKEGDLLCWGGASWGFLIMMRRHCSVCSNHSTLRIDVCCVAKSLRSVA